MEIRSVSFHRAAYQPGDFPRDGRPEFAMAGRSNVGKSSLINALLKRRSIARVSQTPGKTQAVHFYLVNERFYLVDLPGYGYAKVSREVKRSWGELVQGYLDQASALRLIFLLIDARRIPTGEDLQMHEWTRLTGLEERIVLMKSDKLSHNGLAKNRGAILKTLQVEEPVMIACSAVTKQGIDELRRTIASRL